MYRVRTAAVGHWGWGVLLACACTSPDPSADTGDASSGNASTGAPSSETVEPPDPTTGSSGVDDDGGSDAPSDDGDETSTPPLWSTSLEVDEEVGTFLSVWGETTDALYVVGGQSFGAGKLTEGALFRYDGSAWTQAELPPETPTLNWVYGVEGRRFAVGDFGTILVRDGDEGDWSELSCATILPLWGVWGATADDVWIVGGDGFDRDPVLCHYDGVDVVAVEYPQPSFETHALFKVWGTSADHVFAVGDNGLVFHYDGMDWVEQPTGTEADLISLWGSGPDDILAVGGRSGGVISRWDGASWTSTEVPDVMGLNGVFMNGEGVATVVGIMGAAGRVGAGESVVALEDSGTFLTLHAVFGAAPGEPLFAVGGSLDLAPPFVGVILTRAP